MLRARSVWLKHILAAQIKKKVHLLVDRAPFRQKISLYQCLHTLSDIGHPTPKADIIRSLHCPMISLKLFIISIYKILLFGTAIA